MKWSHQLAFALCSSSIPDVLLSFYNGLLLGPPNCPPQWVRQTLAHAGSSRHAVMHSTYRTAQQHAKSSFQKAYNSPDDFDVLQLYYDAPKWFFLISLLGIYWICWMILVSFIVSGKFLSHNVARYFLCFILSLKLKFLLKVGYSPWGSKELDTTEQLNNNYIKKVLPFLCLLRCKVSLL